MTADRPVTSLRQAAAEDLRLLAFLHGKEIDAEALAELRAHPFSDRLFLSIESPMGREAVQAIETGWEAFAGDNAALLDDLAADFAGIYLTYRLRAAPSESPWLDEDNLQRQEPMFEVRRWYERFGYQASDWRERPDDHLVLQLQFVSHMLDKPDCPPEEVLEFMNAHLLKWLEDFCTRVAERCATPFYHGLALLTLAHVNAIVDAIPAMTPSTIAGSEHEARPETA